MKNLLIIGGKSDIAKAVAVVYAHNGYDICLAARGADALQDFSKDLEIRTNQRIELIEFDICDYTSHGNFLHSLTHLPTGVLVAVGYLGDQKSAQENPVEAKKILEVNYHANSQLLEKVAAKFIARGNGFIVGISSVAGERGRQSNYYYGAAKAAFGVFLSGLRNRLFKENVHVMEVRPGFVATKMTAGMDLPEPLTASSESVALAVYKAQQKRRDIVYVKPIWWFVMLVIRSIPESIFKRLDL